MADTPFLDGDEGGALGHVLLGCFLAPALVVLAAVSGEHVAAAEGMRERPRVLKPVEASAAVARVQVRAYLLRASGDALMVYVLDDPDEVEKTKGSAEAKRLQRALGQGVSRGKTPPEQDAARAVAKARPFSGLPGMFLGAGPGKDVKLRPVPLPRLGEEESRPAEQVLPVRMAIIAASFRYKAQVEEFRTRLRLRSDAAVLEEHGANGLPTFRFLGARVERRTLGAGGKPLTPWAEVDVAAAYKPYLLLSGKRFEAEEPPELGRVIFPGLVMPKLLAFRRHEYPGVESRLTALRKSWEQTPEPKRAVPPPAPPAAAQEGVRPGVAKPRPEPLPPGVAKPRRKPAPPKAPPAPAPPAASIPDYCLLRVIDVTVRPGNVYQYRLRVRMANPNFGRKDVAPELARDPELRSVEREVPLVVVDVGKK